MSICDILPYKLAFTALLLFNLSDFLGIQANADSKVHIVYMGRRKHDDAELATSAHHQLLTSVLGRLFGSYFMFSPDAVKKQREIQSSIVTNMVSPSLQPS
ncbi:hypothetical protein RND71_018096 [Anisodus tanguticus]|uniref:Uncharacterized protein n=1 Tax=Anisodus tanguticus TaxID=243964 RepID=A0AAE1S3Q3_9SOLA|nr:hypothetical protein RND71_018096 [Anisodus tanguticus]